MKSKTVEAVGTIRTNRGELEQHFEFKKSDPVKSVRWMWQWLFMRILFARGAWKHIPLFVRQLSVLFNDWSGLRVSAFSGGSMGDTMENDLLKLLFNATTIANVAINATSSPITIVAVALHTADPGESGTQQTSEAAYTSYARVSVTRDSSNWTVTNNSVSPNAAITFPAGTGGSGTVTYWSVGKTASGATTLWFSGTVSPNIVTGNGITPSLTTASAITVD